MAGIRHGFIAGWALRTSLARMWSLGAGETQRKANRSGSRLACEDVRRRGGWQIGAAADGLASERCRWSTF
jgi:hypothetical protein